MSLLKETGFISEEMFNSLFGDADEIGKIPFSILRTTRIKSITNAQ